MKSIDILLINPGTGKSLYQNLKNDFAAIETPSWIAYLSNYIDRNKYQTKIFDYNLSPDPQKELQDIIYHKKPSLICFGIFGQHPSASTQTMVPARSIITLLKSLFPKDLPPILLIGPHPSSLPKKTIEQENIEYVITGDAFVSTVQLLDSLKGKKTDITSIQGLHYRSGSDAITGNPLGPVNNNIDEYFTAADWHKLPMGKYRAHNWHAFGHPPTMPYAAIYTSLGCPYECSFCCSNIQYHSKGIRYRDPSLVIDELTLLHNKYGVRHIKIIDELFIFNKKHYIPILEGIIKNNLDLNIWAYARTDSIDTSTEHLQLLKKAGIRWLALGIESASITSMEGVNKNRFNTDIHNIVERLKTNGILTIGNYIFGLPNDSENDLKETYLLSTQLNTEYINYYCSIAYPGTNLYRQLQTSGITVSDNWSAYAQLSADVAPLKTTHLSASEVLAFRDKAFHKYFERDEYKSMVKNLFGQCTIDHLEKLLQNKLTRNLTRN